MRRSASEVIRNLEMRVARLEKQSTKSANTRVAGLELSDYSVMRQVSSKVMKLLERGIKESVRESIPKITPVTVEIHSIDLNVDYTFMARNPYDNECFIYVDTLVHYTDADGMGDFIHSMPRGKMQFMLNLDDTLLKFDFEDEPTTRSLNQAIEVALRDGIELDDYEKLI